MKYDDYQPRTYTATDGKWVIGVRLANGQIAVSTSATHYASEAAAALEAIRQHNQRPHMNFAVVPAR